MRGQILYVTGVNTGSGKTTLACELLKLQPGIAAMKPFCSGGREDGERLHAFQTAGLTLDEVNPFYFSAPVTPLVAAREVGRIITLPATCERIEKLPRPLLIEGAGGLLSPLGEGFSLLEIIHAIPGKVCIVAENRLGCLNAILLTARQLSNATSIYLWTPRDADESARTNVGVLLEFLPETPIFTEPRAVLEWWLRS